MAGTSRDDGETVNFTGSFDRAGDVKQVLQIVVRQLHDDHFVVELRGDASAQETTYTRKK